MLPNADVDACGFCGTVRTRNRGTTLLTTRLMRADLAELHRIASRRDDGTSVETLLAVIVHEGGVEVNLSRSAAVTCPSCGTEFGPKLRMEGRLGQALTNFALKRSQRAPER